MNRQSFAFILLLTVISSTYSEKKDADTDLARMDRICKASLKAIKEGYFDLRINERAECRAKAVPENILKALSKCEESLPMDSQQAVIHACANERENAPKYSQQWDCKEKAFGKNYDAMLAYAECTLNTR